MIRLARGLGPDGFGTYEIDLQNDAIFGSRVDRFATEIICPGFVDQHIHGAFGIDFMSASSADLIAVSNRLESLGYETWIPTTVTSTVTDVLNAINQLPNHRAIGGFHLEGPFISPEFPGAQPREFIVSPSQIPSDWDAVLDHPLLKIVTLAPELTGSLDLISRLRNRGVRASIGHTNATYDECRNAFEFGASQMTHFYNAMRPFHHRELGAVGYGWMQHSLDCELIYDRLHVSQKAATLLLQESGADRTIAVSDSTLASGLPANQFVEMWGHKCEILKDRVTLCADGGLAGSKITLLDAFRNLCADFDAEIAIKLCCLNPRRSLSMKLSPRVHLVFDGQLEIVERIERA